MEKYSASLTAITAVTPPSYHGNVGFDGNQKIRRPNFMAVWQTRNKQASAFAMNGFFSCDLFIEIQKSQDGYRIIANLWTAVESAKASCKP